MAKKGGNPQYLTPGNPGNRGGGTTLIERQTKQAFLDALESAKTKDGRTAADVIHEKWIEDLISGKGFQARQWIAEMRHGKPNAKVEHLVNENMGVALLQAIKQLTVPLSEEQAKELISAFEENLTSTG